MKTNQYMYSIATLEDAKENDIVCVPNCPSKETIQIWRWLSGLRKSFPSYNDADVLINGIDEEAWLKPREYEKSYCPKTMTCIIRNATK